MVTMFTTKTQITQKNDHAMSESVTVHGGHKVLLPIL